MSIIGKLVNITAWSEFLVGDDNYGTITDVSEDEVYTVCLVRGASTGKIVQITADDFHIVDELPDNDRERKLEAAVRLARLSFMAYQLTHEKKRGVECEKALTNAALVDTMSEALR